MEWPPLSLQYKVVRKWKHIPECVRGNVRIHVRELGKLIRWCRAVVNAFGGVDLAPSVHRFLAYETLVVGFKTILGR